MANYVYITDYNKKGKFAISNQVFTSLAEFALRKVPGIYCKKEKKVRLHESVKTHIHHGIVHVSVTVDVASGTNLQKISARIQNEINTTFIECVDQVPFDVQVKIDSII